MCQNYSGTGNPGTPREPPLWHREPGSSGSSSSKIPNAPGSLEEALAALEADHEFLLKGDVFTPDLLEMWLSYKKEAELDQVRLRPHPYEFALYYDV